MAWKDDTSHCVYCKRPRTIGFKGKQITYCEYHKYEYARRRKRHPSKRNFFPFDAFVNIPESSKAYAAALIEGEGHIAPDVYRIKDQNRPYGGLKVNMCDIEPIQWMSETFGGKFFKRLGKPPRQDQWVWQIYGRHAGAVLAVVVRYLKSKRKREQAFLLIRVAAVAGRFRKSKYGFREDAIIANVREQVNEWKQRRRVHLQGIRAGL